MMRYILFVSVSLIGCLATAKEVLVSFIPNDGGGARCIERYDIADDGTWIRRGVWRANPTTSFAAFGDGWIYTAAGKVLGRYRRDVTPDDAPYCRPEREFWSVAVSPDNRIFCFSSFNPGGGTCASIQRYLVSDPRAGGVFVDGRTAGPVRLEVARQLAFGPDGLLYVGCRGLQADSERSGVSAIDVRGKEPKEVLFYPMKGAMGGFAFSPDGTSLLVHGSGMGRIFRLGDARSPKIVRTGLGNSFCGMRMDGEWYCGDFADGTVKKFGADGALVTVARLRPGLMAMVCLDDVGPEIPRLKPKVVPALCGPLERMRFRSSGTCCLKVGLWAFPMAMDFDRDGVNDLVVSCPDTQWAGTFFFAGTRDGVFKPPVRIDSEWRWNVSVSHVDGEPIVMLPDRSYWDFRGRGGYDAYENVTLMPELRAEGFKSSWSRSRGLVWRYADVDGDGIADRICFRRGGVYWEKGLNGIGVDAEFGPALLLVAQNWCGYGDIGDMDGDGLPDLLWPHEHDGFAWRRNVGTRVSPSFGPAQILQDATGDRLHMHVCMETPSLFDWDGDGRKDIICGDEDGRVALMRNTGRKGAGGAPLFDPPKPFRQVRSDLTQGVLVAPFACDWDGDGDLDLICGDSAGNLSFIENLSGSGVERPSFSEPVLLSCEGAGGIPEKFATNDPIRLVAGLKGSVQGPLEAKWGYTSPVVVDWDGDGTLDVIINSVWGYVYWHRNIGTRTMPRLGPATPIEVEWKGAAPELAWGANKPKDKELMTQWRTTPLAGDWDGDGLPDLIMLDTEGYLAYFRRARQGERRVLLPPQRVFIDEATGRPIRLNAGAAGESGRRKLCMMDWDGDGKTDFFVSSSLYHQYVNGVNVDYWRQTRTEGGKCYFRNEGRLSATKLQGHSCAPTSADFNNDGVPDIVIGGEDGCFYYLRNPRSGKE